MYTFSLSVFTSYEKVSVRKALVKLLLNGKPSLITSSSAILKYINLSAHQNITNVKKMFFFK